MLDFIKNILNNEQFNPGFIGLFVNPFYFARRGLYRHVSELIGQLSGKILDIGCGQKPYSKLIKMGEIFGLELDTRFNRETKKADFFYDGKAMPFADQSFDSLMANQVFEHVFNPVEFMREANRILKMKGFFLLTVPFMWDEHEQPYDFARYSSFGLQHILVDNGFEIVEHRKSNNGIEVIFQLLNSYFYKKLVTKKAILNLVVSILVMSPFNIIGLALSKILPANEDLYLDNVVLARKVKNV